MPQVLGQEASGAYRVRRDDGAEMLVAPAGLTPALKAQAAALAPSPPREKLLRPRDDGQSFDVLELVNEPDQRGYNHSVVSPAQAVKLKQEGGYRLVGNDSAEPPEVQEAFMRVRGAEAIEREKKSPGAALSRAASGAGNMLQFLGENAADAGRLSIPVVGPLATANEYLSPTTQEGMAANMKEARKAIETGASTARTVLSEQFPNVVSPPPKAPTPAAPKQLTEEDFALSAGPAQAPAAQGAPSSATAAASLVPSFRPTSSAPGPGTRKLEKAYSDLQAAAGERAAMEFQRANAAAARQEAEVQTAEQREVRRLEREAQRQAFLQKGEEDLRAAMLETEKSQGEVDPNRWWSSRTTGQKVLAGVASFMTGFARTTNPITEAIAQDIAVQRDNLDRKATANRNKLQNRTGLLSLMRERFSDEIAAERAAEVAALGIAQQRAQVLTTRAAGEEARQRGRELHAELEIKKQETAGAFRQRMAQLALQEGELQLRYAGLRLDALEKASKAGSFDDAVGPATPVAQLTAEQRERFIPGLGLALDKEAAKEARKKTANFRALDDLLAKAISMRSESGSETIPGERKAALRALGKRLELALKEDGELGALDKGSQDFLSEMVGGELTTYGYVLPRLQTLQDSARSAYRAKVSPYMATSTTASTFVPAAK